MYPNDPNINNKFYPMGDGGLTNRGKLRAYSLGVILRERYDEFLGSTYFPDDVLARSTDFDRTKMTLQLVLAGLYPPDSIQKWHPKLNWQPISTTVGNIENDSLLMPTGCPNFKAEQGKVFKLAEVAEKSTQYNELWKKLTYLTGEKIDSFKHALRLYNTLVEEKAMKLPIPEWAEELLASGELAKAASVQIELKNYNTILKKLNGGILLKKMSDDMIAKKNGSLKKGKKIELYSAHDINVAGQILALGIDEPHQPYFTSAVILELYRIDKDFYVQVLYYKGDSSKLEIKQIPGCLACCPLDKYVDLLKDVTPSGDELNCSSTM
ncbi:venom acid phosphatase Acph-1-like isoform X2 [Belonocnema kinseyi]|nr:venom acid phosphatase Acph-1-like isoform X2 [Belonocnema kinseyi]